MSKVERLDAEDENGNATKIVRTTSQRDASTFQGAGSFTSLPTYRTLDGEHLNPSEDGWVGIETGRKFRLI
ncbi:hypothetical protein LDO31_02870 [Luteimonas sp. XNQY3]|nr:hypothetical protein [Luteimonas sp. XNQY3]MCD9005189.1 hypothetical protein [Luteimonas sp. XNQY3]